MAKPYVKTPRNDEDLGLLQQENLHRVMTWCRLRANYSDAPIPTAKDPNLKMKKGQLITGRQAGAGMLNMKPSTFRNSLKKLEDLGLITVTPHSKFSVITVVELLGEDGLRTDEKLNSEEIRTDGEQAESLEPCGNTVDTSTNKDSYRTERGHNDDQNGTLYKKKNKNKKEDAGNSSSNTDNFDCSEDESSTEKKLFLDGAEKKGPQNLKVPQPAKSSNQIPPKYLEYAEVFYKQLIQDFPEKSKFIKVDSKTIKKGADTIRKLEQIDKYSLENDIHPALNYALYYDSFWVNQISSLATLRNKRGNSDLHKFANLFVSYQLSAKKNEHEKSLGGLAI